MKNKKKPSINQQLFELIGDYNDKNEAYEWLTDVWERVRLGFTVTDEDGNEFEADTFLELMAATLEVDIEDRRKQILDVLRQAS